MDAYHLRRANRAVLQAIETPPDTGCEDRLDGIAATLWELERRDDYDPDPGQLGRLRHALAELETETTADRCEYLERARSQLRSLQDELDSPG